MINLIQLLDMKGIKLEGTKYKIHFASSPDPQNNPLDAYYDGKFMAWQSEQNHKNFQCEYVVSIIALKQDTWMFAGVFRIIGVEEVGGDCPYLYQMELIDNQTELIGRVIINFKKVFRASYVWGNRFAHALDIQEIRPQKITIKNFPGYNAVLISHKMLKVIVGQEIDSWKAALSAVGGIYLIIDVSNGKKYVGSASGGDGIWQRWQGYADNCHGGNKELQEIIKNSGNEHIISNFQYSILEIADKSSSPEYVIGRENYWKNVLMSREYGYNKN